MSSDNHTQWTKTVSDHQDDLMLSFNVSNGQLVVGPVDNWIDYCSEGGGAAISSPTAQQIVGEVPAHMCIPLPGSNLSQVRSVLLDAQNKNATGWFAVMYTISSGSSARPAASLPSNMGAWWWLPLLASLAMAVVC